ncbi:hypothetical protein MGLY_19970 [Neomoorella glycerini]|uniref:Uncharacterized protein n=2 Tax=Neomoorella glycerini TaxID=55779 RepID=A0A6I5ZTA0_9FIRM|nr:hypothetical protein MGLY_19970 [Moorella glycerini]
MYGIAKSILFLVGEEPVMVVTCGDVKVSQSRLKQHLGAGYLSTPASGVSRWFI